MRVITFILFFFQMIKMLWFGKNNTINQSFVMMRNTSVVLKKIALNTMNTIQIILFSLKRKKLNKHLICPTCKRSNLFTTKYTFFYGLLKFYSQTYRKVALITVVFNDFGYSFVMRFIQFVQNLKFSSTVFNRMFFASYVSFT